MTTRALFLLGLVAAPLGVHAQRSAAAFQKDVDAIFQPYTATGSPGCIVGVDRPGVPFFAKGYGMANLEYDVPLTAQSISESGSVAKQFTAAAVALLQLDGKLSLDDDIRKYLPEVPDFGARITIRNLLTHTSGLRDQWALLGLLGRGPGQQVHTMDIILDLVTHQRELNFPPGSEYLYSNTGYVLSALIVQRVSGMPFARFTTERIFKPLGMISTQWRDDYRRVVPGRATAYNREEASWVQDMPFTMVHGNGGVLTTAADLQKWNHALTDGLLGKPELTRLLETHMRLNDGRTIDYALGLSVTPWTATVREVSHSGATAGYRTFLARYPEAKTSISVFCNTSTANPVALGHRVVALILPQPEVKMLAAVPATAEVRSKLSGLYRDPLTDESLTVSSAGDFLRSTGLASDTLREDGNGRYSTAAGSHLSFAPSDAHAQRLTMQSTDGATRVLEFAPQIESASLKLADFAGSYRSPELGNTIVVRRDGARLFVRISPDDESPLSPLYPDGFRIGDSPYTLRFTRDGSGSIAGFRAFMGRARNVRFDRISTP
ncbi:MAG: serine hydrolase domain-containing protein [Gemmatimonadaceae bacterium]